MNLRQRFPAYLRLMRLHKPIGIFLLLWPTLWALWIAGQGRPDWYVVILFILGVVFMRSAGCVINDIADRNFDKHVKRTAQRPLTTGDISLKEAIFLFSFLLMIAFFIVIKLNLLTLKLAFIALFLAIIYPFTKRWTYWPQLVLGAAFAMAIPMAFAAQCNHVSLNSWLIYSIAVLWPLMYDTQYAMVDREDDIKINVKSTAILLGDKDILVISLLQLIILLLLILLGIINQLTLIYFISLVIVTLLFGYQFFLIRKREPQKCFRAFLNNQWVGLVVFLGIFLSGTTIF